MTVYNFLDETVIMLGNNSKDIVAIGNAMLSDDEENSEWSDHLKIKITTIVNEGQILKK